MLKHYSHIGMEAKRRAVEALVSKPAMTTAAAATEAKLPEFLESSAKDSTKVEQIN